MFIHREIEQTVKEQAVFYPVITITGPRQSGKTTLCRNLFPEYRYFNLEDAETLELAQADPKRLISGSGGIIIDEAQRCPELLSQIQVTVDEDSGRKFVVTGSSNFALLQSITQSLAGRTALLTLLPLSLKEVRDRTGAMSTDTLILRGFYPQLWNSPDFPQNLFYRNYYSTYVERDVRQITNVQNITLFQKFVRLCAGRAGSEFNASSASGEVGVSSNTISSWISVLSASYVAYLLPPYYENIGKRLVKTPKLYFYDVGLACYLLGIENEVQLSTHPLRGKLFENLVINEALKSQLNSGKDPDLYFFRDKSQHEVDLVHVSGGHLNAYEIKSAQTFHADYFNGIRYMKSLFGDKVARSAVIYDGTMTSTGKDMGIVNFRDFSL